MRRGQGLMLTPWHAARHTHFSAEYGTEPPYSYRVTRGQYLATLAAGGRGFTGYAGHFFLPESRLRVGLPRLRREVRFLEPALAAPPHRAVRRPSRRATTCWPGCRGLSATRPTCR
jgi:hypothetical protein